jgi:hypothetical protein
MSGQWTCNFLFQITTISSTYRIKQLLSFDSVNVWINWLLKKMIFTLPFWAQWISFFSKVNKSTHLPHQKTVIVYYRKLYLYIYLIYTCRLNLRMILCMIFLLYLEIINKDIFYRKEISGSYVGNQWLINNQTCIKRSPLGKRKNGLIRQVIS